MSSYFKKYFLAFLILLLCNGYSYGSHHNLPKVTLGVEVLESMHYKPLRGKKVGLLTHAAGVNSKGILTFKAFASHPQIKLTAIFCPEHGLMSKIEAEKHVDHSQYQGIPVYSLHGDHRKPSSQMLKNVDILVVDIQDIGARSYTYISCLKLCIEACFEQGVEVLVLDRPNPLGGLKVSGPMMDKAFMGYLGAFPIPYIYGLTIGELAIMTVKEKGWLNLKHKPKKQALSIVPMKGWKRSMLWQNTGLKWVPTSPNIPSANAAMGYALSGLGCQIGGFGHGIGTNYPFCFLSHPQLSTDILLKYLKQMPIDGLEFEKAKTKNKKGQSVEGIYLHIKNWHKLKPTDLSFYLMPLACKINKKNVFAKASNLEKELFNKHTGSLALWKALVQKGAYTPIHSFIQEWDKSNKTFQNTSKRYYLYKE